MFAILMVWIALLEVFLTRKSIATVIHKLLLLLLMMHSAHLIVLLTIEISALSVLIILMVTILIIKFWLVEFVITSIERTGCLNLAVAILFNSRSCEQVIFLIKRHLVMLFVVVCLDEIALVKVRLRLFWIYQVVHQWWTSDLPQALVLFGNIV